MQQRQLRLGDILDDYCPRERRLTNHAVVAMVGPDVKQTRCTTCDAEHEYKQAKVPRQRKKSDTPAALYAQALAGGPKKVAHESESDAEMDVTAEHDGQHLGEPSTSMPSDDVPTEDVSTPATSEPMHAAAVADLDADDSDSDEGDEENADGPAEEGPVHRPLIRAQLPRTEGQPPPPRPAPDFTIRQPAGRARFRPRHERGQFQNNRSNGSGNGNGNGNVAGPMRGARGQGGGRPPMQHGGRPPMMSRLAKRQGSGRKRSK
jgi:hypothetical protein